MRLVTRASLGALALVVVLALAVVPVAGAAPVIGIADQHDATFRDPAFLETGMPVARVNVAWDALTAGPAPVDAWLRAAKAVGVEPMVAFNRANGSRCPASPCVLPTLAEYTAAFDAFRARYPWVTTFTPWNEVNDPGQPTVGYPARAAGYYGVIRQRCPACTVLGADVIDNGSQLSWLAAFLQQTPDPPRLWGLHNYVDVNYFRTTGTEQTLAAVPGRVWLTETAGLVRYTDRYGVTRFPYDEDRAARATAFMLGLMDAHADRIDRLYVYGWRSGGTRDTFDTGLLRADGTPRPALEVLRPRLPGRPDVTAPPAATGGPASVPGPRAPGSPQDGAAGAGGGTGAAALTRPLAVTAAPPRRGARRLAVRLTCLAPAGKTCSGSIRLLGGKHAVAFARLRPGAQRALVLRSRRRVPRRPQVVVALRRPARAAWTQVPDPGRPGRRRAA